jgi:uncharacterized protein (TIGR03083 family)
MKNQDPCEAFEEEARALEAVVDGLPADEFSRPTNCPPWSVKELVVHIAICLPPPGALVEAISGPTLIEPADYYRRPERGTTEYHAGIAEAAQEAAAQLPAGATAAAMLRDRWRSILDEWKTSDPELVVELRAGAMRLPDYIVTRVISNAAHGLDLAISLGRPPWTTRAALVLMCPVFVSLFGEVPPDELDWDDQALFARATGRVALTSEDRAALGARAAAFPLLS